MLQVNYNRYATGLRQSRHAHDDTTVSFVVNGSLNEQVGSTDVVGRPLSIVVKPRDTEHSNEFGDGVRTVQIVIPASDVPQYEAIHRGFRKWRWQCGGPAVREFLQLLHLLRVCPADGDSVGRIQSVGMEVLATVNADIESAPSGEPPRWLAVVREQLDDLVQRRSVRELAVTAKVHPVYLAREFRRWFGCSITEYRRRGNAQRAAGVIAREAYSLSRVSHEAGFADQAHMCRVFRAETGMTPGAFRAAAHS